MKFVIPKSWSLRMAQLEGDAEIGVGRLALDPVFDAKADPVANDEPSIGFGRFVELMRRQRGLTLERLSQEADVEVEELVAIEEGTRHKPQLRTVYQLALFFKVPQDKLQQVAGLTTARDTRLHEEAVRFAARSESIAKLTPEEHEALAAFVTVLSERK